MIRYTTNGHAPVAYKLNTKIKKTAAYGCPNCGSFDQTHGVDLGHFGIQLTCNFCGFFAKDVNPNQPYGILSPEVMTDGDRNFSNHPQVIELKKQAKKWRLRKKISAIIGEMLT